jgi:peptide/nickel transport system substrate-binding protein
VTSQTDLEGVAGQLRNVGIKAAVNAEQISAWLPQFLNGTSTPLFQRGIAWSGIYDVSRAYQYIQLAPPSVTMVKDAKWEALYAKQATELNPTARLAALQACARYVNEENYILWTYGASTVGAWKKGVTGVNLDTGVMLELADIAKAV